MPPDFRIRSASSSSANQSNPGGRSTGDEIIEGRLQSWASSESGHRGPFPNGEAGGRPRAIPSGAKGEGVTAGRSKGSQGREVTEGRSPEWGRRRGSHRWMDRCCMQARAVLVGLRDVQGCKLPGSRLAKRERPTRPLTESLWALRAEEPFDRKSPGARQIARAKARQDPMGITGCRFPVEQKGRGAPRAVSQWEERRGAHREPFPVKLGAKGSPRAVRE